jgi:hypothetical protein
MFAAGLLPLFAEVAPTLLSSSESVVTGDILLYCLKQTSHICVFQNICAASNRIKIGITVEIRLIIRKQY